MKRVRQIERVKITYIHDSKVASGSCCIKCRELSLVLCMTVCGCGVRGSSVGRDICSYRTDARCCAAEANTHCKAIVPILKKNSEKTQYDTLVMGIYYVVV